MIKAAGFLLLFTCFIASAQNQVITVPLTDFARDDRFDKFMITMPVFLTDNDTILTMDYENLRPAIPVRIKKPAGYNYYGYAFIFFTGIPNKPNPGFVNVLIGNVYSSAPHLFIDRNNNYDFTDDGDHLILPGKGDSLVFPLNRLDDAEAGILLRFKRLNFDKQTKYRNLMNEYYAYFYKDRKFAGIEHSYREQRFICRAGTMRYNNDSFRIAVYDGNSNGFYNEGDSDKVITANFADSFFESRDGLRSFMIPSGKKSMYVENHGEQFEVVEIDKAGKFIRLRMLSEQLLLGRINPGKRIPKFKFTNWRGTKEKISKYKKKHVYLYFTGPNVSSFHKDTAVLRTIAALDTNRLKVIAFIDVNKSYELKIFGSNSNLNWVAAYKDKEINRKLFVRGLPSSIWVCKRRKVIRYNLSPEEFLHDYQEKMKNRK